MTTSHPRPVRAAASRAKAAAGAPTGKAGPRNWSRRVMETSDALDLEPEIFKSRNPERIAASLKASAQRSTRRKGSPFQSAMSMLTFYINRAGRNLSATQRGILERAKVCLRIQFGRPAQGPAGKPRHRRGAGES